MTAPPDDAIATRLRDAGLHRATMPVANGAGPANAWIIDDDPLTLVDAGLREAGAIEGLEAAFAATGRRLQDVGLVLITHGHTDHLGLTAEVVRRSGADVAALAPLGPYLADFAEETARDRTFMADLLRRHGADDGTIAANTAGWERFHSAGEACAVTVPLLPGSRVTLRDRTLELLHRPGHSETDCLLVDAERRLAFGGDHVLRAGPSVPVRDRPLPAGDGARPYRAVQDDLAVLVRYRGSLRATRTVPVDVLLPGHGGPFATPVAVIDAHLARQERDAEALLARAGNRPFTAVALSRATWPTTPGVMAHVRLSAVLGGLGLLREAGRVALVDDGERGDGPLRFVAT